MALSITVPQLLAFRARRQFLAAETRGRTSEDVFTILRTLQPYPPTAGTKPGTPPHPRQRVVGYQDEWSQELRSAGRFVKGRFTNGIIAYVALEDLDLYAAAFRQPIRQPPPVPESLILSTLRQQGNLPKTLLRGLTRLESIRFDRALLALNRAFEIMEIQKEDDWDSPWGLYERVYLAYDPDAWNQNDAQAEVLRLFTRGFGPATILEMVSWSGWGQKTVRSLVDQLLAYKDCQPVEIEGQAKPAYLASEDIDALGSIQPVEPFLIVLAPNDPLVMPQRPYLLDRYCPIRFPYCWGVIVVNGAVSGAAWGHYKRQYIHIEVLSLDWEIIDQPSMMDNVLAVLENYVGAAYVPVHIHNINGDAEAPWVGEILTRNGYTWEAGYYVKPGGDRA